MATLQFAKIFESAGLQLLVRAAVEHIQCNCGRNGCPGAHVRYSLHLEAHHITLKGTPGLLAAGIPAKHYEHALALVERFDQTAARLAVEVLQQAHVGTVEKGDEAYTPILYQAGDRKEVVEPMAELIKRLSDPAREKA